MKDFRFKREITGIKDQWHSLKLPDDIFGKLNADLSDLRIYGITESHDTIEAPYLLKSGYEKITEKDVAFKLINKSKNAGGYFFTFEVPSKEDINQIKLNFQNKNFDWKISLEGSQDQKDWFNVLEDYRILSLQNELTDYHFTTLNFPSSKFRYFRLFVPDNKQPELESAKISMNEITAGHIVEHPILSSKVVTDKQNKQTIIHINLPKAVPVSNFKISVKDPFDYYRPLTIEYLTDSFKAQTGWQYHYTTLTTGTLNSIELNEFKFNSTILQKLKITIDNQDNEPLHFGDFMVNGNVYELNIRFANPANYFLTYGNKNAAVPNYDIERFADKIPEFLPDLTLGAEQIIAKTATPVIEPLFKNKIWLWVIMGVVILLLGWFGIRMIRN